MSVPLLRAELRDITDFTSVEVPTGAVRKHSLFLVDKNHKANKEEDEG